MKNTDNLYELIDELTHAAEVYYQNTGEVTMTDEEYDEKLAYLRGLLAGVTSDDLKEKITSLLSTVSGGSAPTSNLVKYSTPMLSLGKANTEDEITSYAKKAISAGAKGFTIQSKLDGFAIEAKYSMGKLVRISTRGDGHLGEDISYLMGDKNLSVVGLPHEIENDLGELSLRGEIFARVSQFEKINSDRVAAGLTPYKNPRNGTVGLIKGSKAGIPTKAEISFVTYSALVNDKIYVDLSTVNEPGVVTVDKLTKGEWESHSKKRLVPSEDIPGLLALIEEFGKVRGEFDIPTDGVVIKPTNEAEVYYSMGLTSHHPLAFIAFKYPSESKVATVLGIDLSTGKTGKITPRATITPVSLDGSIVTKASCHNFNWLYEKGISVGSKVIVTKANDIIPAILSVVDFGENDLPEIPTVCEECGSHLVGDGLAVPKTLTCPNYNCPGRKFFVFRDAFGKQGFDIDGLNNATLQSILDYNLGRNLPDFFRIDPLTLSEVKVGTTPTGKPKKLGKVRAEKITSLLSKALKSTPAYKVLISLNIQGVGTTSAKTLIDSFDSIEGVLKASEDQLLSIDGFGEITIDNILSSQERALSTYSELRELGLEEVYEVKSKEIPQVGTFSITGAVPANFKNRNELVVHMESKGYSYDKSPKKTTTLVIGDPTDTSSKMKKALSLGLTIIHPDDFAI